MPDESSLGRRPFLVLVVVAYALMAGVALLWLWLAGRTVRFGPAPHAALLGLVLGLAVAGLTRVALARTAWARQLAAAINQLLPRLGGRDILIVAAASGLAEELFFRGALQPAVGLLPASLIFGCLHVGPSRRFLPWTAFALCMGLALGLLYDLTGDLAAPLATHVSVNALNLHAILRLPSQDVEGGGGLVGP